MPFRWRVNRYLDWDGPWGWCHIEIHNLLCELVPKLHDYETMTWSEVEGPQCHFVSVDGLCGKAQRRLEELRHEVDMLFSVRITGKARVWGIREVSTLHVLWWDPEHTVYPSKKKGT